VFCCASETTQLATLNPDAVVKLMRTHLFSPALQSCDEVSIVNTNLSDTWVEDIWQYIARHFPNNLTPFHDLHILPGETGKLIKLQRHSAIIVLNGIVSALPDPIQEVCKVVGVQLVKNVIAPVCNHKAVWGEYILRPDACGMMTALTRLDSSQVVSRFQSINDEGKREFLDYVANAAVNNATVLNEHSYSLLHILPMFQAVRGSGFQPSSFVSLTEVTIAAPTEWIPVCYPERLLDSCRLDIQKLLFKLNVKTLTLSDALTSLVFPAVNNKQYTHEQISEVMRFICDRWSQFQNLTSFIDHMKNVRFVERRSGDLVAPCELFSPHDSMLMAVFYGEDVFPVGVFAEASYTHVLKQLGLKGQESVTATDVWHIASRLNAVQGSDTDAASDCLHCANELLSFLEQHYNLLTSSVPSCSDSLLNLLNRVRWVPILRRRPDRYPELLPFQGENNCSLLAYPSDVLSSEHCFLIGSVRQCLDVSVHNISRLAAKLSWTREPNIDDVVQHLQNVIAVSTDMESIDLDCECIVKEIYTHLNDQAYKLSEFVHQLNEMTWVVHANGFARIEQVVRKKPFTDLQPYVYVLPLAYQKFEQLWTTVGMADSCNLVVVLKSIATLHESQTFSQDEVKRDLQYVINILNEIAGFEDLQKYRDSLLIPVDTGDRSLQMQPIDECTYCDKEWYQQGFDVCDVANDVCLVHRLVPTSTAEMLNIHSIVSRMLKAEELHIGLTSYGQQPEPLTKRLRNILNDYTDGLAVIKELIQNADDAGAKEVRFLYDERQNNDARTKLLDPRMKDLQGPALWIYNDESFTTEDFEHLVKISGGTKEHCKDKIGRFGLGFNAVYNLTDLPALVSRNYVVYLDPHTKYLNKAIRDKSKPGIKLDMTSDRRSLQYFSDQFKPFNGIFGCNLSASAAKTDYPATLFRFPLRTQEQSDCSEICNRHYSREEMMTLLSLFLKSADHLLLFTQNVRTVSVCHLAAHDEPENIKELYCITKNVEKVLRFPEVDDKTNYCAFLQMANSSLKAENASVKKLESSLLLRINVNSSAIARPLLHADDAESHSTHWLVSSCMGQQESLQFSYTRSDLISVAGVAAQLENHDGQFTPYSAPSCGSGHKGGIIFCFLPLPFTKTTDLPVHINGFFAVTSSRMHLVEKTTDDKSDNRAVWNELLMKDAVKLAYENLLQDVLQLCKTSGSLLIWPMYKPVAEAGILSYMTDNLYTDLFEENGPKVCKLNGRYVSLNQCRMLEADFRESEIADVALQVLTVLTETANFEVIDLPVHLLHSMLQTSASQRLQRLQISKHEFYLQWFLPNISSVDTALREQLILSALFDSDVCDLLHNFQCIPTLPNGKLRKPCDLVHPLSCLSVLYDEEEERFPLTGNHCHGKYQKSDIYAKLLSIGMKRDDLSWQELLDRCAMVPQKCEISGKRLAVVIRLMSEKVEHVSAADMEYIDRIKKERFLPVHTKPSAFPLPWKGDEHGKFTSCEEAYLSDVQNLVCCIYPVIDDNVAFKCEHTQLKRLFGLLDKPISMSTVLCQLDCVVCHVSEHTNSARKLEEICEEVYSFLGKEIKSTEYAQKLKNELCQKKCIFVSSKCMFMQPVHCAKKLPVTSEALLPYLYKVTRTMYTTHGALLDTIGVKECFEAADYIRILQQMHNAHLNVPIRSHDMKVALNIINNCLTPCTILPEDMPVYVPNLDGILCAADTLRFNSCQWLTVDDDMLCHAKIPYETACKLQIKTIEQEYFMQNSIGIPFGQKEKLVTRIHKILTGYPFGKGILKEMLQNADDAGATELHFINDERQLPAERVFDERLKPLQGPALCVYDNKPFTQNDIAGIQNLGEGSKSDDPTKTGQYGVGFSSVYHITDVPSLLTFVNNEQVLCFFDPHCRYVPGATPDKPGRMLNNISSLQTKFPDIFDGYYNGQLGDEQGSIFRLPLRNDDIAKESEISQKPVSSEDILNLFAEFKSDMYMSLLFLNSVKRICLMSVDAETGLLTTTYSVTAKLSPDAEEKRERFQKLVKETARQLKDGECLLKDVGVHEVTYRLITEDSNGSCDEWTIVQRFGFENPEQIPHCVNFAHECRDLALLPRGGVAYQTNSSRKYGSKSSQLFCFLPLPGQLKLPVSINGHFVLDYETRQCLWRGDKADYKTEWNNCLLEKVITPAYCTLIDMMRQQMLASQQQLRAKYFALFPSVNDGDSYICKLSVAIYRRLQHMSVLPVHNIDSVSEQDKFLWIKPVKDETVEGFFDDLGPGVRKNMESVFPPISSKKVTGKENHEIVKDVLINCGFFLFVCPMNICENFQVAGVQVKKVSPKAVLEFFRSYHIPDTRCRVTEVDVPISDTPFKDVKTMRTLLEYCTQAPEYKQLLNGSPLLVTSDGFLREFDDSSVKYEPRFADILPHIPDHFLHKEVFSVLQVDAGSGLHLCKMLTMENFVTELPSILPLDVFYGAEKRVAFSQLECLSVLQNATGWIQQVWAFLQSLTDNSPPQQIIAVLKPLAEWCILPACNMSQRQLIPVMNAHCVLLRTSSIFTNALDNVLCKLDVLRPLVLGQRDGDCDFYYRVLGSIENAENVINAVEEAQEHGHCLHCELTISHSETLLDYFMKHISLLEQTPNSIPTLQRLPIFCTIHNKLISIKDCCVYVLPKGIPFTDMEAWSTTSGTVFLKSNFKMKKLFEFLGCKHLTDTEVYCSFIFMHFEMLSPRGRYEHLLYVRDKLLPRLESTLEHNTLVGELRTLHFIPRTCSGHDCDLATASEFFDDSVELFRAMHPATDFVPKPYQDNVWTLFLRECGMIHDVSQEKFLHYAKQVAVSGEGGISKETAMQSNALLKHLLTRQDVDDHHFLQKLRNIAFIVPHCVGPVKERLYPQFGKRNSSSRSLQLVAFEGSVSSTWANAIWSVQSTVSASIFRPKPARLNYVCSQLKFDQKPKLQNVVQHVQLLCTKLVSKISQMQPLEVGVISDVLKSVYNMLQKEDLPDAVITVLSTSPCVIDVERHLLLRPQQIVLRMPEEDEIEPYLISIPLDLGPYNALFSKLGSSPSLTINHYIMVLQTIYKVPSAEDLHPNEMKAVHKAMKGFFTNLKSLETCDSLTSKLYLLGRDKKMHKASTLIFDDLMMRNEITDLGQPFFVTLRKCDIDISVFETRQLLRKLPAAAQPQFLSAIVTEVMDTNHEVVECELADCLNAKLQSEQFKEAITRLMLHSLHKDVEKQDMELVNNDAERLKMIEIVAVNQLKTCLTLKGERIAEHSPILFTVCENSSGATKRKVYFCVQKNQDRLFCKFSEIINDIMSDYPKLSSASISSVLRCPLNTEHNELDLLDIKQYTRNPTNQETYLPVPGTFVPIIHHHLLRQDITVMKSGDYAALEKYDPAENDEPGEPTYIIVQIIEQKNCDIAVAPFDAKYAVDIGRGQSAVVSAASLYIFSRHVICAASVDEESDETEFVKNHPMDYDDVINDLKITLTDAWKIEQPDRNKILKRLILQWHPDNNSDISDLANRVTQFILFAADRLDRGLPLNDSNAGAASSLSQLASTPVPSTMSSSSSSSFSHNYYQYMSQRAREHHQQQKEYVQNYEQNTSHVVKRKKQHFFQTSYSAVNPQPGEGRRWLRQAEMDVQAAKNDEDAESKAYEWACYKYYKVDLFIIRVLAFS